MTKMKKYNVTKEELNKTIKEVFKEQQLKRENQKFIFYTDPEGLGYKMFCQAMKDEVKRLYLNTESDERTN